MKNNTWQLLENAILETLEGRQMMSAAPLPAASLANGIVTVNSAPNTNARVVVDYGSSQSVLVVNNGGNRAAFPINDVKQLDVNLGSGSDYYYMNPALDIPADVHAGDGNDVIRAGAGDDSIIAGNGHDVIYGKGGNNRIAVGSGDDVVLGAEGNDTIVAGNGNDSLVGGGGTDVITAGNGNDSFLAGDGRDTITAGTGNDVMIGGSGNTYVYGKTTTTGAGTMGTGTTGTGATRTTTTGTGTTGIGTKGTTTGSGVTGIGGTGTTKVGSGTTNTGTNGSATTTTGTGTTTTGSGTTGTGTTGTGTTGASGTGTTTTGTGTTSTGTTTVGSTGTSTGGTGATSTSTTGLGTDDVGTTFSYGWSSATGTKPSAAITTLAGTRTTGMVINVSALDSTLGGGTPIDCNFVWNFGDTNGAHNIIDGYNAAHVYDQPGTYTVSLTLTNMNGLVSTMTQKVTIAASQRTQIYVDSTAGSDTNSGTISAPLQSLAAAFAKLSDNTEILLRAGESFTTTAALDVTHSNVLIGRYGTGANPTTMRQLLNGSSTITVTGAANGVTIQDIDFDSPYPVAAGTTPSKIGLSGIFIGGTNVTVRDCTFLNVDDAINENSNPTGVLIQDNTAPLSYGVRGYFVWGQGQEEVIIGNNVYNSSREHNIRLVDLSEVTVEDNTLRNTDGKGCIECHLGNYEWVQGNDCTNGDIRVGPLGLWGEDPASSTDFSVIVDNQLTDTFIYVQSGAHHVVISNNVITSPSGASFRFSGVDSDGRTSSDITLINNTAVDTGTQGNFINLGGFVSGVVMKNNVWIAPNIQVGAYGTTPVYVNDTDMSSFTEIGNNIWPAPDTAGTYANGGLNFVGTQWNSADFLTAAQWNAESMVGNDVFQTVKLGDSYQITVGTVTAGSGVAMAA